MEWWLAALAGVGGLGGVIWLLTRRSTAPAPAPAPSPAPAPPPAPASAPAPPSAPSPEPEELDLEPDDEDDLVLDDPIATGSFAPPALGPEEDEDVDDGPTAHLPRPPGGFGPTPGDLEAPRPDLTAPEPDPGDADTVPAEITGEVAPAPPEPVEEAATEVAAPVPPPRRPPPERVEAPTPAHLDAWPCALGVDAAGPALWLAVADGLPAAPTLTLDMLYDAGSDAPRVDLRVTWQPEGGPPHAATLALLPDAAALGALRAVADQGGLRVVAVTWSPRGGWTPGQAHAVDAAGAIGAVSAFSDWLATHPPADEEAVAEARQAGDLHTSAAVSAAQARLDDPAEAPGAVAALLAQRVPAAAAAALAALPALSAEALAEVAPQLTLVARWHGAAMAHALADLDGAPAEALRAALVRARAPALLTAALGDDDRLQALGDAAAACAAPRHLEALLDQTTHSRLFYRSQAALCLAALWRLGDLDEVEGDRIAERLETLAETDRSKAVRQQCRALLETDADALAARVLPA